MCRKHCIGKEIKKLSHMILRQFLAYETARGREDVTKTQGHVLAYLYEQEGRDIFQKDVEAEFSISRSTATGILKLMEKEDISEENRLSRTGG